MERKREKIGLTFVIILAIIFFASVLSQIDFAKVGQKVQALHQQYVESTVNE